MIALHCHILPDIDDSAKPIENSLAMALIQLLLKLLLVSATSHHKNERWINEKNNDFTKSIRCSARIKYLLDSELYFQDKQSELSENY